jgi:carboxy-cis,cis-muconate cyclase
VFQVDGNGTLASAAQVVKYSSDSAVHGLSLSRDQSYLYSADDTGNAVWTHKIQPNGTLTYVGKLTAPSTKSDPRHATTHPNGTYLYVVLEGSNQIAVYPRDSKTGELSNASQIFSLLPTG